MPNRFGGKGGNGGVATGKLPPCRRAGKAAPYKGAAAATATGVTKHRQRSLFEEDQQAPKTSAVVMSIASYENRNPRPSRQRTAESIRAMSVWQPLAPSELAELAALEQAEREAEEARKQRAKQSL